MWVGYETSDHSKDSEGLYFQMCGLSIAILLVEGDHAVILFIDIKILNQSPPYKLREAPLLGLDLRMQMLIRSTVDDIAGREHNKALPQQIIIQKRWFY